MRLRTSPVGDSVGLRMLAYRDRARVLLPTKISAGDPVVGEVYLLTKETCSHVSVTF